MRTIDAWLCVANRERRITVNVSNLLINGQSAVPIAAGRNRAAVPEKGTRGRELSGRAADSAGKLRLKLLRHSMPLQEPVGQRFEPSRRRQPMDYWYAIL